MRSARLRHKITIESNTPTANGEGTLTDVWSTFIPLWADPNPKGGREIFQSEQFFGKVSIVFRTRYRADVIPAMRITWGTRTFDILSVLNIMERSKEMLIACEEDV